MNTIEIIEVGTLVVTIVGVIIGIKHFYQQHKLAFYAKYTERCAKIMKDMPCAVFLDQPIKYPTTKAKENFVKNIFLYFDLCSEEYYLAQNGYLEDKVWNEWSGGMKAFFEKDDVNEHLQNIVRSHRTSYPDFIDFLIYDLQIKDLERL